MDLTTRDDVLTLFVIAAVFGAIGGIVADLLLVQNKQSGMIELPGRRGSHFDLGTFASIIVGAVAAMIGIYIFPPETVTTVQNGISTSVAHYDLVKLIPLSLLIGTAGSAFMAAAQTRVNAAAKQQQLDTTKSLAESQLSELATQAAQLTSSDTIKKAPQDDAARQHIDTLVASIHQARRAITKAAE